MILLKVDNLKTHFTIKKSWRPGAADTVLKAVDGVSFSIASGEVLSLVGESGCGKSTVGRTLTRLENASSGTAQFDGRNILNLSRSAFKPLRRHLQMIFQDPFASLNPRLTIEQTLAEPLFIHGLAHNRNEARERISAILEQVGLSAKVMKRHPHEFSGGQRQRIGIARVMILSPKLIIADEPVSALDVSIQAQVINLIKSLQKHHSVAMLFISHDLGVVRHISDHVAVMYLGRIVEIGSRQSIFNRPHHPYTRLLLASIPRTTQKTAQQSPVIFTEPGNAMKPPSGCAFHPRCPHASELCQRAAPELKTIEGDHLTACHHAVKIVGEAVA